MHVSCPSRRHLAWDEAPGVLDGLRDVLVEIDRRGFRLAGRVVVGRNRFGCLIDRFEHDDHGDLTDQHDVHVVVEQTDEFVIAVDGVLDGAVQVNDVPGPGGRGDGGGREARRK